MPWQVLQCRQRVVPGTRTLASPIEIYYRTLCLEQFLEPAFAVAPHLLVAHMPCPLCLRQRPRNCASVSQPFTLHSFLPSPPCLAHLPLLATAVLQLAKEQNPRAPCFAQSPRARTAVSHPADEQMPFAPCFVQSPRAITLFLQPDVEQTTLTLCTTKRTPLASGAASGVRAG